MSAVEPRPDAAPGGPGALGAPGSRTPSALVRSHATLAPAARAARRLGLFGGSFDPPHAGHLHVLERARRAFALDHVVLVPARRPPHKKGRVLAPDADRVAMLETLLAGEPETSIWTDELLREGPSYTLDTVRRLRRARGEAAEEPFLLIGSDNLAGLAGWHGAEELLGLARPIVVRRRGAGLAAEGLATLSPAARARVEAGLLDREPFDASSSDLRARLARDDPSAEPAELDAKVEELLPPRLREYVRARGIYHRP